MVEREGEIYKRVSTTARDIGRDHNGSRDRTSQAPTHTLRFLNLGASCCATKGR